MQISSTLHQYGISLRSIGAVVDLFNDPNLPQLVLDHPSLKLNKEQREQLCARVNNWQRQPASLNNKRRLSILESTSKCQLMLVAEGIARVLAEEVRQRWSFHMKQLVTLHPDQVYMDGFCSILVDFLNELFLFQKGPSSTCYLYFLLRDQLAAGYGLEKPWLPET
eukprot:CAMPEP_0201550200 /NCGR_PEP_ID=MMETSP0173_2-20130828/6600_1 /ASSEMBLY_ACC=CAM_ASM_000268 /TAXON_ID=218659 /ORGANISM="Vexillifera sp., Strain DIVA3 564/2" /LENGTH=165 /DNA_ID=CAMNT_0047960111 /DNA_START=130 /DNA_END=623 /DNA_ORIENTATION=+